MIQDAGLCLKQRLFEVISIKGDPTSWAFFLGFFLNIRQKQLGPPDSCSFTMHPYEESTSILPLNSF